MALPVVMNMLLNAGKGLKGSLRPPIEMMTAGAAPPAAVIERMEGLGFHIAHVYGLTEVYGPAVVCDWHEEWDGPNPDERARLKARQGVTYPVLDDLMVADPETLAPVPPDGATMGEIFMRGNIVKKGYLKNPKATGEAFAGRWFHSGDLAVAHPDGYIEIKDRSKDIIISGRENISTIEVEDVLYRHPAVLEAAIVARPDPNWGETPCAFATLRMASRPRAAGAFQGAATRDFRAVAQHLDRQDPKILAARTRQGQLVRAASLAAAGTNLQSSARWSVRPPRISRGSVPLELDDFVLDAELLPLQVGDRVLVWQGTLILLIDGAL